MILVRGFFLCLLGRLAKPLSLSKSVSSGKLMSSGVGGLTGNQNDPDRSSCWQLVPREWCLELNSPPRNGPLICDTSFWHNRAVCGPNKWFLSRPILAVCGNPFVLLQPVTTALSADLPTGDGVHGKPRLLIAEDESSIRIFLNEVLQDDYEIEVVHDGAEAWAAVQRQSPDLLLTDFRMPVLDGLGLTLRLRADARWTTLPIVVLTGITGGNTRFRCLEAGANVVMETLPSSGTARLPARPTSRVKLRPHLGNQAPRTTDVKIITSFHSGRMPGGRSPWCCATMFSKAWRAASAHG